GASGGSPGRRQVMHTRIVVESSASTSHRLVVSGAATRVPSRATCPREGCSGIQSPAATPHWGATLTPRHPARRAIEPMVGLLARGSLPVPPSRVHEPSGLQVCRLAAHSCGGSCGFEHALLTAFPVCACANKRPSI